MYEQVPVGAILRSKRTITAIIFLLNRSTCPLVCCWYAHVNPWCTPRISHVDSNKEYMNWLPLPESSRCGGPYGTSIIPKCSRHAEGREVANRGHLRHLTETVHYHQKMNYFSSRAQDCSKDVDGDILQRPGPREQCQVAGRFAVVDTLAGAMGTIPYRVVPF